MTTCGVNVQEKNKSRRVYSVRCSTLQLMKGILPESECRSFVLNVSPCVRMRPTTMSILGQSKLELFSAVLKDANSAHSFL